MAENQSTTYRVKPGDLVVSLKEVLDRIDNRLTEREKDDLLAAFLARRRREVKPGDLITADQWNQIVADIVRLNVRIEQLEKPAPGAPPETPPGNGPEVKAAMLAAVLLGEKYKPLEPKQGVKVWAESTNSTERYEANPTSMRVDELIDWGDPLVLCKELEGEIGKRRTLEGAGDILGKVPQGTVTCFVLKVPPETYRLKATAEGYGTFSRTINLTEGMKRAALLCLDRSSSKPPSKLPSKPPSKLPSRPPKDFPDRRGNRYRKIDIAEVLGMRPPEEIIWWWKDRIDIDPGPEVREWIEQELQGLLDEDPELEFTAENPRIHLDPNYSPDDVADTPYAILTTRDGAAISLILTPAERVLPRTIPIGRSGIPDLDVEGLVGGEDLGPLASMEVFASATAGMVSRALRVSLSSARSLITEMREKVADAVKARAYYPGLTAEAGGKLIEKGLDTDIKLANADPKVVAGAAGLSESFAARVIDHARQLTPEAAWSVRRADLGLDGRQYRELDRMQIESLGQLEKALSDPRIGAELKSKLEMSDTSFEGLKRNVESQLTTISVRLAPESSLTSLKSVDRSMAAKLVTSGLGSVSELAAAPLDRVSAAVGVPEAEALKVRNEAMMAALSTRFGLNREDAAKVVRTVGTEKLGDAVGREDFSARANVPAETASRLRLGVSALARMGGSEPGH